MPVEVQFDYDELWLVGVYFEHALDYDEQSLVEQSHVFLAMPLHSTDGGQAPLKKEQLVLEKRGPKKLEFRLRKIDHKNIFVFLQFNKNFLLNFIKFLQGKNELCNLSHFKIKIRNLCVKCNYKM